MNDKKHVYHAVNPEGLRSFVPGARNKDQIYLPQYILKREREREGKNPNNHQTNCLLSVTIAGSCTLLKMGQMLSIISPLKKRTYTKNCACIFIEFLRIKNFLYSLIHL